MTQRKYALDDFGYFDVSFFDILGNPTLPDLDASLYIEFRDSANVLQFTATTTSTPAIQSGTGFVFVENIPLTGWATGNVQARTYAKLSGANFSPYPLISTAFEVIDTGDLVSQLRDILHIDDNTQDAFLLTLIQSAADYAEEYLARSLLTQSRSKQFQAPYARGLSASVLKWPTLVLTYPPVQAITRVYTTTDQGSESNISSSDYWLDEVSEPPELHIDSISWSNKLRVDYTAGYGANYDSLPDAIQRGILLHAAHMFKYRGDDCSCEEAAKMSGAIGAYRIYKVVRRG